MLKETISTEPARQPDEREMALRSISLLWRGDLAAYLDALARLKEAKEAAQRTTEPEVDFSRLVKR